MRTITSRKSDRLRELTALHKKSNRQAAGTFLAEGPAVVGVALRDTPHRVREIFVTEKTLPAFEGVEHSLTLCSPEVMEALSPTPSPQGVIALCSVAEGNPGDIWGNSGSVVILDSVADPGNMGTIIRTADAAGAAGVFAFGDCVDFYNDKVVRSSAGSVFRVPLSRFDLSISIPVDRPVYVLEGSSTTTLGDISPTGASPVWIIGSEAHGVSNQLRASLAVHPGSVTSVRIPMRAGVESLNAAISLAICLYSTQNSA